MSISRRSFLVGAAVVPIAAHLPAEVLALPYAEPNPLPQFRDMVYADVQRAINYQRSILIDLIPKIYRQNELS